MDNQQVGRSVAVCLKCGFDDGRGNEQAECGRGGACALSLACAQL
jgi:hypothetical protein